MSLTAESSNYFMVALHDDKAEEQSQLQKQSIPPQLDESDKTSIRQLRIAAAIERSKTEYKPEHAYAERNWLESDSFQEREPPAKSQIDRQRLEYIASCAYFADPPEYGRALGLVLLMFDPSPHAKKSLGGLSRELLDIGINAAMKCGDKLKAISLADSSMTLWKGQFAGIAASAADAYMYVGNHKEAVKPLLQSIASFGIHYPIVRRLSLALEIIMRNCHEVMAYTNRLRILVDRAVDWRKDLFQRHIYSHGETIAASREAVPERALEDMASEPLDVQAIAIELELDAGSTAALHIAWKRLSKGLDMDIQQEKSIKEL